MQFNILFLICIICIQMAKAEEYLLQIFPSDYQVIREFHEDALSLVELIPDKQEINNWEDRLSTIIFYDQPELSVEHYFSSRKKIWKKACPQSETKLIINGEEDGYSFILGIFYCTQNAQTNKPEYVWFKAMRGEEVFYVVQKTFRYRPSKEVATRWTHYLKNVIISEGE